VAKTIKSTADSGVETAIEQVAETDYRMKDLIRESGLPRKTIHYYINEGLLPPPKKSGRNTATYGSEHLERLRQICILREQQFLPIKAIKAVYNNTSDIDLTIEQEKFINELRLGLPNSIRPGAEKYVNFNETVGGRITATELKTFKKEGLITVIGTGAASVISKEDAVVLESWIGFKNIGFAMKGYDPTMLKLWDSAIEQLVVKEIAYLSDGIFRDSQTESLEVARNTMTIVKKLIEALHYKKTRTQFKKMLEERDAK